MTATHSAAADGNDAGGRTMAEQIRLLYQNTSLAQLVTILNGALLAAIQGTALGYSAVAPWFVLLVAVSLSRVALSTAYDRATPERKLSPVWRDRYCLGAALAGAVWGASSFMLFTPDSFVHQIFLAFVLSGMMAGAIGIMASWFPAFALFSVLVAMPTVASFAMVGEGMHLAMAWLIFLFMATMLVVAYRVNRAIAESLQLRFENEKLIDVLTSAKARSDALNSELLAAQDDLRKSNDELEHRVLERTLDLSRANEELEKFAYAASHDLQEPLRTVANFAELLNTRYADRMDGDGREFIGYVVSGAQRMRKLIDDLLAYARIDAKAPPSTDVDCNTIVSELREDLKSAIEESGAVIDCETLPLVRGNAAQLKQVFSNLLANAIKFRSDKALRIQIRSVREGDLCIISVQDNGIGIGEKYLSRVFDMYERLHSSTHYPGTGMGLALCKKIIGRHHGKIWVDSAEGRGSTFHFSLPAARR